MYESFEVRNFRCFQHVSISDLGRVNLISGVNNVGKTALLEALFLHCGAPNPQLTLKVEAFRGVERVKVELGQEVGVTVWDSLFRDFDTSRPVEISASLGEMGRRTLRLRVLRGPVELEATGLSAATGPGEQEGGALTSDVAQVLDLQYEVPGRTGRYYMILDERGVRVDPIPPRPPFKAYFQSDRAPLFPQETFELFGNLQRERRTGELVEALRILEPDLVDLELAIEGGEPVMLGDTGRARPIPVQLMGGGMVRLLVLIVRMANTPGGAMLVDEIDNGFHHSVLVDVWRVIRDLAHRVDTQVFATTHSFECVAAAHAAFAESMDYDFRLHRLERVKGEIQATTYEKGSLAASIESRLEVR